MDIDSEVAPDGSPVAVYLALPAEPEFTPVLAAVPPNATVLDLGCGVGRLSNVLAGRGHRVTGVDESRAMLEHLDPCVEAVHARVDGLALGRAFDVVVLASHLVNVADADLRRAFLQAAASHASPSGTVLIEHYDPRWMLQAEHSDGQVGDVGVRFQLLERRGDEFDASVTLRLGGAEWEQLFSAKVLDDRGLDVELGHVGLRRAERLSPTWLAARRSDRDQ